MNLKGQCKGIAIAVILVSMLFSQPVNALNLEVTTDIPEYITDEDLNLTGTTSISTASWIETENSDFLEGSPTNTTIVDNTVLLKPELEFQIENNGNPVLDTGSSSEWDSTLIGPTSFLKQNGTYYQFYHGSKYTTVGNPFHIGVATSDDGITWIKYEENPILRSGIDDYDYRSIFNPQVIIDNGIWKMYYSGMNTNTNICLATSTDGFSWTKYESNPILNCSFSSSDWNGVMIAAKGVHIDSGTYKMYIVGQNGDSSTRKLGLAQSVDGIHWMYHEDCPFYSASDANWYGGHIGFSCLEKSNGSYRMWTLGKPSKWAIGWIQSDDGIHWEDSGGPVITAQSGTIYAGGIHNAYVFDEGDHFLLYAFCMNRNEHRSLGCFRATPTSANGEYISRQFDAGGIVELNNISWSSVIPDGGTLTISVRWANQTDMFSEWMRISNPQEINRTTARYIQYKASFHLHRDWFQMRLDAVRINYTIPIVDVEVSVDDGPLVSVHGSHSDWYIIITLKEGSYDIVVRALDAVGDQSIKTIHVYVDRSPPVLEIVKPRTHQTRESKVTIDFNVTDNLDPIPICEWRFGEGEWKLLTDTTFESGLEEGDNIIKIRATDAAGNSEVVSWEMERTEPIQASTISLIAIVIVVAVIVSVAVWRWLREKETGMN